jgi:hypothetical protein
MGPSVAQHWKWSKMSGKSKPLRSSRDSARQTAIWVPWVATVRHVDARRHDGSARHWRTSRSGMQGPAAGREEPRSAASSLAAHRADLRRHRRGSLASQAQSASSILVTRSNAKPQANGLGLARCLDQFLSTARDRHGCVPSNRLARRQICPTEMRLSPSPMQHTCNCRTVRSCSGSGATVAP